MLQAASPSAIGDRCNHDAYCMGYRGIGAASMAIQFTGGLTEIRATTAAVWIQGATQNYTPYIIFIQANSKVNI